MEWNGCNIMEQNEMESDPLNHDNSNSCNFDHLWKTCLIICVRRWYRTSKQKKKICILMFWCIKNELSFNSPNCTHLSSDCNCTQNILLPDFFFCVGVMYSGEYYDCDVTLSIYPHRASLKNMPVHGGNRTYNLWNTSPMLC